MADQIYNINPQEFTILDREEYGNNVQYTLEARFRPPKCPVCKSHNYIGKGVTPRKCRDLNEFGKLVGLVIQVHRYICKDCGNDWSDEFQSIAPKAKMTNRMREYIYNNSIVAPFSEISRELDISVPTIKKLCHEKIAELDASHKLIAPRVLGMDETMLQGKYRGMYADIEGGRIIDMTEDRKLDTVRRWLYELPKKERVECCTIDMWGPYKDAIELELPGVPIVIDKFHVFKHVNANFDDIRKHLSAELTPKEKRYIKGKWRLLNKNASTLEYGSQLTLHNLLESFPQFKEPHSIKEDLKDIYAAQNREDAEEILEKWAERASQYEEYKESVDMIYNWKDYIFNYFDHRVTNATTEALNNLAKEISAKGRGYSYDVLKAKVIYRSEAIKPVKFEYKTVPGKSKCKPRSSVSKMPPGAVGYAMVITAPACEHRERVITAVPGTDIGELMMEIEHWGEPMIDNMDYSRI